MPPDRRNTSKRINAPVPEDRKRVEHMLRCSRDAQAIVGTDSAAVIEADMVRARAIVKLLHRNRVHDTLRGLSEG